MPYCLLPLDRSAPIVLDADDLVLGRGSSCDLKIRGCDMVSRRHCRLTRAGHAFRVVDLNSRNGVRINGHRIQEQGSLKPGDTLRLGGREFVLASRSQEVIEALKVEAHKAPTEEMPGMTQPLRFLEELRDDEAVSRGDRDEVKCTAALQAPSEKPPQKPPPAPPEKQKHVRRKRRRKPAKSGLRDIGQKSWDAIVAFERRAPKIRRKPPRQKKLPVAEPDSNEAARREPESASADRALMFGYTSRAVVDSSWDYCRLGLRMICWSGLAAGLLVFLTWMVPSVGLLVETMRMTAETLALQEGTQMVLLGVLPVIFCVTLREIAPGLCWPAIGVILLSLLLGQVIRPSNPEGLFVFTGAMQAGLIVTCIPVLAGTCLMCLVPRRSRLRRWAALAAGCMLAVIGTMSATALAEIKQISWLALPVGRPPAIELEVGLIVTALAAPLLLLVLMRGIGSLMNDRPLVDAVNTCLVCVGGSAGLAIGVWFLVVSGQMTDTWADVFLLLSAAGVNMVLIWTAQTVGFTRDAMR